MNTKKAVILGTLGAILIGLVSFAITKYKPKTMTSVYADTSTANPIEMEMLDNGYTFNVDSYNRQQSGNIIQTPIVAPTFTEKPSNLTNSTWWWKDTIDTTNFQTETTFNINIAVNDINYSYTSITIGPNTIKYGQTNVYNNGWIYPVYKGKTTFVDGTDIQNQNLINFIWLNTTPINYRYYSKHQTRSETYLGIETYFASQKTYTNNSVLSEGLFLAKIQSNGLTQQLVMESLNIATKLETYWLSTDTRHGEWKSQIKFSKTNYIGNMNPTNLAEKINAYETYYNNIQNKENIYTGTWNYIPTETNHNWRNDSYYTNETGQRVLEITNANAHGGPYWTNPTGVTENNVNILSQARANYIAVYFNCKVKNYYPEPQDDPNSNFDTYHYWYEEVAIQNNFIGYGISNNPVTPPDIENGNFLSLTGMIMNILSLPFTFIAQAFDITLWADTPWAFNIKNFIFIIIAIMAFMFIIKLFTSGFSVLGNFMNTRADTKLKKSQTKLNKQKYESNKPKKPDKNDGPSM